MENSKKKFINLTFIRHGKTISNEQRRYVGVTDEPLSQNGILEINNLVKLQIYPQNKLCFVSPLRRCTQTADIIFKNIEKIEIDNLREMDFGIFEKKNYEELKNEKIYQEWIDSNCEMKIPGGESKQEFTTRIIEGFKMALNIASKRKLDKMAFAVHGGTIMSVLSELYGGNYYDYQVKNGKGYECLYECDEDNYINGKIIKIREL